MAEAARRPRIVRRGGVPAYARGKKRPAWAMLAVPFVLVMVPLYRAARGRMNWLACLLTVAVFEAIMIPVEHASIIRGHWVYNENRILGPLFWGIPVEEPLIYYLLPPIFVILVYESVAGWLAGKIRLDWRTALGGRRGRS